MLKLLAGITISLGFASLASAQTSLSPSASYDYESLKAEVHNLNELQFEDRFDDKVVSISGRFSKASKFEFLGDVTYSAFLDKTQGGKLNVMQTVGALSVTCVAEKGTATATKMLSLKAGDPVKFTGKADANDTPKLYGSIRLNDCRID